MIVYGRRVDEDRWVVCCDCCLRDVTSLKGADLAAVLVGSRPVRCRYHEEISAGRAENLKRITRHRWEILTASVYDRACLFLQKSTKWQGTGDEE